MKGIFVLFLAFLGFLVTFAIYPPAFTALDNFIDNIMPALGFGSVINAYVGLFPLILLVLLILCSFWAFKGES